MFETNNMFKTYQGTSCVTLLTRLTKTSLGFWKPVKNAKNIQKLTPVIIKTVQNTARELNKRLSGPECPSH